MTPAVFGDRGKHNLSNLIPAVFGFYLADPARQEGCWAIFGYFRVQSATEAGLQVGAMPEDHVAAWSDSQQLETQ